MKKVLCVMLVFAMLLSSSVMAFAGVSGSGGSGAYDPVILDEIQKGTVLAFDSEEGAFNETTYYVKILGEDGKEYIYALADRVCFEDVYYDAEEISQMDLVEITFVLRSEKIKYINPRLPDGLFESVNVIACYLDGNTIYADVEFENIVDKFKLIMAAYDSDKALCSVKSFDISYLESYYELDIPANGGEVVKLFLWESVSGLEPLCEAQVSYITTKYGYLVSANKTAEEYTFEIFTPDGEFETFTCAEEIVIDEETIFDGDARITDRLEFSAESANSAYTDETNVTFHQPVMYAVNESGEIKHIDTVVSGVNKKISKLTKEEDGDSHYVPYEYSKVKNANNIFNDFKVNSSTKIIFVPDDRSDRESYRAYSHYSYAFIHNESYHVEAYGLSNTFNASLVLMYKENDDMRYTHRSPMMIVNNKALKTEEMYITGYSGTSDSLKTVKVNEKALEAYNNIDSGDVVRYLTNNLGEIVDVAIWYDADNPVQATPCNSIETAISNRILELVPTRIAPAVNAPDATFRLQYGTVWDIEFNDEGDMMWITPSINKDSFEMVTDGDGVVGWEFGDTVNVYKYDGEKLETADLTKIIKGETEVITYSSSGELRTVYIVKKPYVSEKKIMAVQKGVDTTEGCELTGYSEGEEIIVTVDAEKEPVVSEVYAGKVIAYVPDGDTIKDIEIVFSTPTRWKDFNPENGEDYIAEDTKETVVFGLADYSTDGVTVNGTKYTMAEDTNYLLMKYISGGANKLNMGIGKANEMKNSYVLIRVKEDNPTVICDAVIFQGLN